jgi:hypothetical protein
MGRWDRFHEARVTTAAEVLKTEIVKELAQDLSGWPPPVLEWKDAAAEARYAAALAPDCPRPSDAVIKTAFQLATWELERNFDALDEFARNDRAAQVAGDARERLCLDLLGRWLTDVMLELKEVSPLKRADLVLCLQRARIRILGE